jgi:hypothetical protein
VRATALASRRAEAWRRALGRHECSAGLGRCAMSNRRLPPREAMLTPPAETTNLQQPVLPRQPAFDWLDFSRPVVIRTTKR